MLLSSGAAQATTTATDRAVVQAQWSKIVRIMQGLRLQTRPRSPYESVSCAGADGLKIAYRTGTSQSRTLTGPVSGTADGRTVQVSEKQVETYLNDDARIVMAAYKGSEAAPFFSLDLELARTLAPKSDEVATYRGEALLAQGGRKAVAVTCSVTRPGAGTLEVEQGAGNVQVKCFDLAAQPAAAPLASFEVARNASGRLVSDVSEMRGPTDSETLPAFLVSQFRFGPAMLAVELDDASPDGNLISRLTAEGRRLPSAGSGLEDVPLSGVWVGSYERFDAGRQIRAEVQCLAR